MNLIQILREKCTALPCRFEKQGVEAVILHIERAELYWQRGKTEGDELLFTDVIYRTNQAFEGILKEAYSILANEDASRTPPHKIEDYLSQANLFRPRVLTAFTHYRMEWRNEATHNYKLFFSEQEALLAIHSVSSFCVILMDQILTKAHELQEKERAQHFASTVRNKIKGYKSLSFQEKMIALLQQSYAFLSYPPDHIPSEYEWIGLLAGFIKAVDSSIQANTEAYDALLKHEQPDLLLSRKNEHVLVKIKRHPAESLDTTPMTAHAHQEAQQHLIYQMKYHHIQHGILMLMDEQARYASTRTLKYPCENQTVTFIQPSPTTSQTA